MNIVNTEIGWGVSWPAPGKLNLMLRITGRRDDGYHLLQTVFQFINWCDELIFHHSADGSVRLRNCLPGVPEEQDLAVRAAKILQRECSVDEGVEIEVTKRLPMGGGLGGGSSDAATTLLVMNRLWDLDLPEADLMRLGLELGADVPVFLAGFSAWAEGVGERLEPVEPDESWYTIVVPPCQVSTVEVFTAPDLTRDSKPVKISSFMSGMHDNDCLPVVKKMYPSVGRVIDELSGHGEARLTGTGACVYLESSAEARARGIAEMLCRQYQVEVVQGLNRSPLQTQFERIFGSPVVA